MPDEEFEDDFLDFVFNGVYVNEFDSYTSSRTTKHIAFETISNKPGLLNDLGNFDARFGHYLHKYKLLTK